MSRIDIALRAPERLALQNRLLAIVFEREPKAFPLANQIVGAASLGDSAFAKMLALARQEGAPELFPCVALEPAMHLGIYQAGREKHVSVAQARRILGARIVEHARKLKVQEVLLLLSPEHNDEAVVQLAEGIWLGSYSYGRFKREVAGEPSRAVIVCQDERLRRRLVSRLGEAHKVIAAQNWARDLVNEPPSLLGPSGTVLAARQMARTCGLEIDVFDGRALSRHKYAGILAVGRGADEPPQLVILRYRAKGSKRRRVALVGKGVTFDTGGYCLKQAKDMWHMKGDMAGAAAVFAAMQAIAQLAPPIDVVGIVPLAKNVVDAKAYLPGDVLRMKNGKTVHVTNTDAEGRLLLADGLIRAGEEHAEAIVDIATLTGSVVRALGPAVAGIMGNNSDFTASLIRAGAEVGEHYWELPMLHEYRDELKSHIADVENVGRSPNAGAILGALFLEEFVPQGVPWAHLDIAGPFFVEKQWHCYRPGATGFGVRTLVRWVQTHARHS